MRKAEEGRKKGGVAVEEEVRRKKKRRGEGVKAGAVQAWALVRVPSQST